VERRSAINRLSGTHVSITRSALVDALACRSTDEARVSLLPNPLYAYE